MQRNEMTQILIAAVRHEACCLPPHSREAGWSVTEKVTSGEIEQAVRTILRHLVEHPDAKDTVEGIVRWWGDPADRTAHVEVVRRSLEELTQRGWVSIRMGGSGICVYGLNKDRLDEVKRHLHG
jgi:hypothetical protein